MKCPECDAEIDSLLYFESVMETYDVWLDTDGYLEYEMLERDEAGEDPQFACPECLEVLFCSLDEADSPEQAKRLAIWNCDSIENWEADDFLGIGQFDFEGVVVDSMATEDDEGLWEAVEIGDE